MQSNVVLTSIIICNFCMQYLQFSEKAMATHSSTLAWKIPWMEEPGGLQCMGSLRVGHDWATSLSLFTFHALEKEMATHSSILAWRISGMGEPGGLPSMGSHRVGHDWSDLAAAAAELLYSWLVACFWQWHPSDLCFCHHIFSDSDLAASLCKDPTITLDPSG